MWPIASWRGAFAVQTQGLIEGGSDAILIETCQDPLQAKAAVNGARAAFAAAGRELPLMVQVTIETTGAMLVGTDIAAAATIMGALDVPVLGLNCATGPKEMAEHIRHLGQSWPGLISVLPNAGLPELRCGHPHYPLGAEELARWLERFIQEDGVNIVGGCCGTGAEHIAAVDAMLRRIAEDGYRPRPKARQPVWSPSLASLFSPVPLRQESAFLAIGERCNANGSKKFRELQASGDWDGCVAMGKEQAREASHALDVCTAYVGRDEVSDMREVISRMRGQVDAPLVIDSTELPVLESALELYGGKAVLNSINFEDGEGPAEKRMALARKHGSAVIALTIDEVGMAKTAEDKLRVARRLVDFACGRYGLPQSDLLIDPLTFTVCTGNEDDRKLGLWTLDAIETIRAEFPELQIILGLSNISFGLNAAARHVLNSVMLDHAMRRGLTGAIVHSSKIMPLHKIPEEEARTAEDLIFDRRRDGYDPLHAFIALFADRKAEASAKRARPETVEERLKLRIVDGDKQGLEAELEEALQRYSPLDIINTLLLDGMKTVGELFGAGKMQLPFVLQSAETMKKAVAYLEPLMERVEGTQKGTIVLATVKGDVHDIGKNLVDIILTNNGYRVVNLGIKQPLASILEAAEANRANAVGMSGLLVKSTVIMRENLEEMARQGLRTPVLLGGAALTRAYVEEDCFKAYGEAPVAYARDAFDGLALMDKVMTGDVRGPLHRPCRQQGRAEQQAPAHAGSRGRCPAFDPAACRARGDPPPPPRADPGRAGADPTLLGHGRGRAGAGQGAAALPQRADALSIPLGLREAGQAAGGVPALGAQGAAAGAGRPRGRGRAGGGLHAPGGLRLLQGRGRRQRYRPLRRGRQAGARPLRPAASGQGGRPVRRRLPARRRRGPARRAGPSGRHRRPARLRGRPGVVRAEPLPGLCAAARAGRGAGRGAGGVCPRPHPRRARLRPRGRARDAAAPEAGLSRQPLQLRLSRLPQPRRPGAAS